MCVSIFRTTFVWTFLILVRIERDVMDSVSFIYLFPWIRAGLEIHMDMENGHIITECTKQLKQYLFL